MTAAALYLIAILCINYASSFSVRPVPPNERTSGDGSALFRSSFSASLFDGLTWLVRTLGLSPTDEGAVTTPSTPSTPYNIYTLPPPKRFPPNSAASQQINWPFEYGTTTTTTSSPFHGVGETMHHYGQWPLRPEWTDGENHCATRSYAKALRCPRNSLGFVRIGDSCYFLSEQRLG